MKRTRVLLLDPLPLFRAGVRRHLTEESDFEVVEAGTVEEARALEPPDIALVDMALLGAAARLLTAAHDARLPRVPLELSLIHI